MTDRDRLKRLIDELPDVAASELLDFAEFLRAKQARTRRSGDEPSGATAEDRAWLEADLSCMDEVDPFVLGVQNPLSSEPVSWDADADVILAEVPPR